MTPLLSLVNWLVVNLLYPLLGEFVNDHLIWVFPACETLHFMGLSLLVGTVGLVDLRLLGMAKMLPFAPLHRLIRWGIFGFITNLLTGILFFVAHPNIYPGSVPGEWKMWFVLSAGINVLVFRFTVFRKIMTLGPGDDAPLPAKVIAATSLFLWVGVIWFGRILGV